MDIRNNYIQQKNNRNNVEGAKRRLPTRLFLLFFCCF